VVSNRLSIEGGNGRKKKTSLPTRGGKIITLSPFARNLLSRKGKHQRRKLSARKVGLTIPMVK